MHTNHLSDSGAYMKLSRTKIGWSLKVQALISYMHSNCHKGGRNGIEEPGWSERSSQSECSPERMHVVSSIRAHSDYYLATPPMCQCI